MLEPKPFRCQVNADLFRRVAIASGTEYTRHYLTGVHVEPDPRGGVSMTATDGHILINIHDPDGYSDGNAIVRLDGRMKQAARSLFKASIKGRHTEPHGRLLVVTGTRAGLLDSLAPEDEAARELLFEQVSLLGPLLRFLQWNDLLIDGTFPDWRQKVVKPVSPLNRISINPELLGRIGDALGSHSSSGLTLFKTDHGADFECPILIRDGDPDIEGTALLMPMRHDEHKIPPWWPLTPPTPAPCTSDMADVVAAEIGGTHA